MHVAGPISTKDEAAALEQAAFLFDLQSRLHGTRRRTPTTPRAPRLRPPL